jgi:hypothetical protein
MAVRTKMTGMRLPIRLDEQVEAYRAEHDLTFTEAMTAILERGLESINGSDNSATSDYQDQIDRLTDDLNRLTEMVNDFIGKSDRSSNTPKPKRKKIVAVDIADDCEDEVVWDEPKERMELVVENSKSAEIPIGLSDDEFAQLTGMDFITIDSCKATLKYCSGESTIEGYYFNREHRQWEIAT